MGVADSGDERKQQADKRLAGHSLCGDGRQELMQTAVEGDLAPAVDVGIGVGALDGSGQLPRILDQLLSAEIARPSRGGCSWLRCNLGGRGAGFRSGRN